jgi:FAD/FMN-containing dehydrogenase
MAILPPGVSQQHFDTAINRLKNVVGDEWVFTSDADIHAYRDHFSYIKDQPNELIPCAAVGPDSVEQVQAIVRIANEFQIPLYSISTGKNFAYGGPGSRGIGRDHLLCPGRGRSGKTGYSGAGGRGRKGSDYRCRCR